MLVSMLPYSIVAVFLLGSFQGVAMQMPKCMLKRFCTALDLLVVARGGGGVLTCFCIFAVVYGVVARVLLCKLALEGFSMLCVVAGIFYVVAACGCVKTNLMSKKLKLLSSIFSSICT